MGLLQFLKFGRLIARNLRESRPQLSLRWHLDEMVIKIHGRKHWLWRAVDHEGEVLNCLVQPRRCVTAGSNLSNTKLSQILGGYLCQAR